jgi:hypothetical protein
MGEGWDAKAIEQLAGYLDDHGCAPAQISTVSIDMSPAFIAGVGHDYGPIHARRVHRCGPTWPSRP